MPDRSSDSSGSIGMFFREELRQARSRAGLTQEELADKVCYSMSLVAAIETGRRMPSSDFAAKCDEALGACGMLTRLQPLVAREAAPVWFREWAAIEGEARLLRSWEPVVIPGLLQTEDYAANLLSMWPGVTEDQHAQRLSERMARQEVLSRDYPPELLTLLDERILRYQVGSRQVMRSQMDRLLELASRPTVSIQLVPASAEATRGLSAPFMVASFADIPDVGYLETTLTSHLVERHEDTLMLTVLFDKIRGSALPCGTSEQQIREAVTAWT